MSQPQTVGIPQAERPPASFRPLLNAAILAAGYALLCGLYIAVSDKLAAAQEHEGTVSICQSDLQGACFRVSLPIKHPPSPVGPEPTKPS